MAEYSADSPWKTFASLQRYNPKIQQEILLCEVGSSAHGVSLPGSDDLDLTGVAIEYPEHVFGLDQFDHEVFRTAAIREGKSDARSQPGDIDLTLYSLRKFIRMAAKGNPTVLMLLYAPPFQIDSLGEELRAGRDLFLSKQAGKHFLGYLTAQRERLLGERGQKDVKRPELVDKYGHDTKYAMHMLRLGIQGVEYMYDGKLTIPMEAGYATYLKDVRLGKYTQKEVVAHCAELEDKIDTALKYGSLLPDQPDKRAIGKLAADIYRWAWEGE